MILADAANNIILAIEGFTSVFAIAGLIVTWARMNKTEKREVIFAGTPVDKKDFDATIQRVDRDVAGVSSAVHSLDLKLETKLQQMSNEAVEGRRLLHARIDPIKEGLAGLSTQAGLAETRMFSMDAKLDRLIERQRP